MGENILFFMPIISTYWLHVFFLKMTPFLSCISHLTYIYIRYPQTHLILLWSFEKFVINNFFRLPTNLLYFSPYFEKTLYCKMLPHAQDAFYYTVHNSITLKSNFYTTCTPTYLLRGQLQENPYTIYAFTTVFTRPPPPPPPPPSCRFCHCWSLFAKPRLPLWKQCF